MQRRHFLQMAAIGDFGAAAGSAATPPAPTMRPDAITDVPGIKLGHFTDAGRPTGYTVLLSEEGATAWVDVRGSAPGTREADLLAPTNLVDQVHAILLAGGDAFGLEAATGVVRYLEERKIGFPVGAAGVVPIVSTAILFDLYVSNPAIRPDAAAGYKACDAATMDGYQGQGHANPASKTRLRMSLPTLGAVMVSRDGHRFVREDIGPSALAARVLAQPGQVALEVFDATIEAQLTNHSAYVDARGREDRRCDTPAALAAATGVPAATLAQTLVDATRYAHAAIDPLGRTEFARVLAPPYRASWVTGSLAHSQGGVVTDRAARVLDDAGEPLRGLFAAGGSAAGLSGPGGDAYLPGNGLAQSFGLAWLAVAFMAGT